MARICANSPAMGNARVARSMGSGVGVFSTRSVADHFFDGHKALGNAFGVQWVLAVLDGFFD